MPLMSRYGISAPFSDYAYSSPAKALLTDATTGGWVKREDDEGVETDHLSFKDTGVQFDLGFDQGRAAAAPGARPPSIRTDASSASTRCSAGGTLRRD